MRQVDDFFPKNNQWSEIILSHTLRSCSCWNTKYWCKLDFLWKTDLCSDSLMPYINQTLIMEKFNNTVSIFCDAGVTLPDRSAALISYLALFCQADITVADLNKSRARLQQRTPPMCCTFPGTHAERHHSSCSDLCLITARPKTVRESACRLVAPNQTS